MVSSRNLALLGIGLVGIIALSSFGIRRADVVSQNTSGMESEVLPQAPEDPRVKQIEALIRKFTPPVRGSKVNRKTGRRNVLALGRSDADAFFSLRGSDPSRLSSGGRAIIAQNQRERAQRDLVQKASEQLTLFKTNPSSL